MLYAWEGRPPRQSASSSPPASTTIPPSPASTASGPAPPPRPWTAATAPPAPTTTSPTCPGFSISTMAIAFHGTYWHNNFGTPMSHGCVNLTIEDARMALQLGIPRLERLHRLAPLHPHQRHPRLGPPITTPHPISANNPSPTPTRPHPPNRVQLRYLPPNPCSSSPLVQTTTPIPALPTIDPPPTN